MKIKWENTQAYYHELLQLQDESKRTELYIERFIQPWAQMMQMVQRRPNQ